MHQSVKQIPVARPHLGEEEAAAARDAILTGWVTQGPQVEAFESEFASMTGAPFACAVSSCTAALHMALVALGIGDGDEVITVSHSFIATANAIRYTGAKPVFVDIERDSCNIDPERVEAAISPRTRAILAVHQIGHPCDLTRILHIAQHHSIPVIEDAACAVGSAIRMDGSWQMIGKPHGLIACFSFHPRKVLTTGEGGMITTSEPDLLKRFTLLRQHGMTLTDRQRHNSTQVVFEEYPEIGYNYRMTDIQAAIGRVQLRKLPRLVARRRELAARYSEAIATIDGIECLPLRSWETPNFQSYAIRVLPHFSMDRNALMQFLLARGISTRPGIMNAHQEGAHLEHNPVSLPNSEDARNSMLLLPLFPDMTNVEISYIIDELRAVSQQD